MKVTENEEKWKEIGYAKLYNILYITSWMKVELLLFSDLKWNIL